ncbi:MAG: eL32 family ribosomal protein [Candidatus Pacearchaeota archaeon]
MTKKFLRRTWSRYAKLGKGRKKKQKWRKPTGRDNKMREKRKGYPAVVSIGYKKSKSERKNPFVVNNIKDLENAKGKDLVVLGNIGKKKKIELLKKASEMKISFQNVNSKKLLKKISKVKEKKESVKKENKKSKKKTKPEKKK